MSKTKYKSAPVPTKGLPKGIPYIIGNEAAQAEGIALGEDLLQAGAPWVEGNPLPR